MTVVEQRDVPGIDCAYLAMDTEEGVEVVWNEVQFSERKNYKAQEDKIRQVFESLTQLQHPNIVNFHRYWTDTHNDKPRVIFITEYMSSGSLKQFLKRTKRNVKKISLTAWKRWCTQILSALRYVLALDTPILLVLSSFYFSFFFFNLHVTVALFPSKNIKYYLYLILKSNNIFCLSKQQNNIIYIMQCISRYYIVIAADCRTYSLYSGEDVEDCFWDSEIATDGINLLSYAHAQLLFVCVCECVSSQTDTAAAVATITRSISTSYIICTVSRVVRVVGECYSRCGFASLVASVSDNNSSATSTKILSRSSVAVLALKYKIIPIIYIYRFFFFTIFYCIFCCVKCTLITNVQKYGAKNCAIQPCSVCVYEKDYRYPKAKKKTKKKNKNKSCGLFFSYLHSCSPPIIHGNLTCDTIFIQHNGLVKIGSGKVPHERNMPCKGKLPKNLYIKKTLEIITYL
ncbi:hypothetical protein AGLY_003629 [Aphis glycines]|uniref:Protein kinase domain-containing protein n=1 Tax=Aphis glycines TaxID=307491 RepID=A0A6G0TZN4_APHGL|nr:hypothetical protein AGLY_003629 [Aphis glycines]